MEQFINSDKLGYHFREPYFLEDYLSYEPKRRLAEIANWCDDLLISYEHITLHVRGVFNVWTILNPADAVSFKMKWC